MRTAESLLERDATRLAQECGQPLHIIEGFRLHVARHCAPRGSSVSNYVISSSTLVSSASNPFESAANLLEIQCSSSDPLISTGNQALDCALGGGVHLNEVTEVVGRSGSGKTQLCFTLAAVAAQKGFHVLYLDTVNSFSPSRVLEIIKRRKPPRHAGSSGGTASEAEKEQAEAKRMEIADRIRVEKVFDVFAALEVIESLSRDLPGAQTHVSNPAASLPLPSKLLIVDSVTALMAPILGGDGRTFGGQALMGHFASSLHRLVKLSRAAVVVVNEARGGGGVADSSSSSSSSILTTTSSSSTTDSVVKPALGQSWGYTASVRLGLCAVPSSQPLTPSKKPSPAAANRQPPPLSEATRRISATILKHPRSPAAIPGGGSLGSSALYSSSVEFLVGPSGVC